jgi:hypothetical protein
MNLRNWAGMVITKIYEQSAKSVNNSKFTHSKHFRRTRIASLRVEKCLARVKSVVATSGDLARNAVFSLHREASAKGFAQVERFLKTNLD